LALLVLAAGCDNRNSVQVYQAPKETPAPDSMPAPTAANPPMAAPAVASAPTWVVPQGWSQLPAQEMRYATFAVDATDPKLNVIVYTFGPESGALLPNVNRWEQQIGAPVSAEADLPKVVTHMQNNGSEIDSIDLKGPPPQGQTEGTRMLSAIIPANGQVWFLKFVGPASKVTAHKAEYDGFLKSISFGAPSASPVVGPVAQPTAPAGTGADPHAGTSLIPAFKAYTVPQGWALDPQERPMRVATFHIADGTQQADVIVSMLPADKFGTPEANMNRWRGQVGLDPVADATSVPRTNVTVDGGTGFVVDLTGADQQLVVAQITKGSNTFFFKLIGPSKLVEAQKKAFDSFLQSVQFAAQ
jgi:hypothetical protein